jgi:N-acetylglucosamine-6-sulfatase
MEKNSGTAASHLRDNNHFTKFTRRTFLKGAAMTSLIAPYAFPTGSAAASNKIERPNILFIMSDDHTYQAISAYGSYLKEICPTDNIDRIATEGIMLKNCFCTNSICTPSRASILSGQYSHKNGVYTLVDNWDPNHHPNVAVELKKAGYETAVIGKWHLHTEPKGFDYYNVLPGQGLYFDPLLKEKGTPWQDHNEGGTVHKGYSSDVITDEALKWLKQRSSENNKPFFLMCHFKAPHGLWEFPKRHEHLFDGVDIPEPPTLFEDKSDRSIGSRDYGSTLSYKNKIRNRVSRMQNDWWPSGKLDVTGMSEKEMTQAAYQKYLKDYLRCVAAVNDNVGRLLDYLDQAILKDNTVVIYTGDQGMLLGEHDHVDKRWMFEEALKMPFLARYPKEIKPNSVNDDIINNVDFAPTFLDFAEGKVPAEMQGCSFRSILMGNTPSDWKQATYYRYWMHRAHHDVPAHYGIRTRRHKLIFFYGKALHPRSNEIWVSNTETHDAKQLHKVSGWGNKPPESTPASFELYDLEKDPFEMCNMYGQPEYTEVAKELKAQLLKLKQDIGDTDENYPELMELFLSC